MAKVRMVALLDPEEVSRLDGIATANRVSRGHVVRQALRWWSDYCYTAKNANGPPDAVTIFNLEHPAASAPEQ